jgi:Tol biopolymer transport system component
MFFGPATNADGPSVRPDAKDDGRVLRVVNVRDDRGSSFHPRPSPDGRLIAFDSDREGERGVYVANADGGAVRRISGDGFAAIPSW